MSYWYIMSHIDIIISLHHDIEARHLREPIVHTFSGTMLPKTKSRRQTSYYLLHYHQHNIMSLSSVSSISPIMALTDACHSCKEHRLLVRLDLALARFYCPPEEPCSPCGEYHRHLLHCHFHFYSWRDYHIML